MSCYTVEKLTVVPGINIKVGNAPKSGLSVMLPASEAYAIYDHAKGVYIGEDGQTNPMRHNLAHPFTDPVDAAEDSAFMHNIRVSGGVTIPVKSDE